MRIEEFSRAITFALGVCVLGACAVNPPAPIIDRIAVAAPLGQVAPVERDDGNAATSAAPIATPSDAEIMALAEPLAAPGNEATRVRKPVALAATLSVNPAIAALLAGAKSDIADQRYSDANAKIDRALQIGPDSPQVWHRFAKLKFAQGEYEQALSLAQRSNSLAPSDGQLRAINWLLVADVERIRGDAQARAAALEQARQAAAKTAAEH